MIIELSDIVNPESVEWNSFAVKQVTATTVKPRARIVINTNGYRNEYQGTDELPRLEVKCSGSKRRVQ